jgi:hypothetical protein
MKKRLHKKSRLFSKGLSRHLVFAIGAAVAILTIGLVISFSKQRVNAKDPRPEAKQPAAASDTKTYITRNVGGQTVQIDPQTGQIKPLTPEEAQKLANGLKELANQSNEGLRQVQHADGSVSMNLEGRFQNVALARKEADGGVAQACVDNPQAGAAFFRIDPRLVEPEKTASASSAKSPANK